VKFFWRPFLKRFALSCWTVVCLSSCPVLSMTLAYCGQTVGRIKIKLGIQVGLGPGHTELDGDAGLPPPKGHIPQFSAHICCAWPSGLMDQDATCQEGRPRPKRHCVTRGPNSHLPKKGIESPNFRPMSIVARRLRVSRWHLV